MESSPTLPADMNLPDCAGLVAKSIRDPFRKSFVFTKLAEAYGRHSRNDKATEVLTEAFEIAKVLERDHVRTGSLYKIALVAASLGNSQQARAVIATMDPHYGTLVAFDIAMLPAQRNHDDAIEAADRMEDVSAQTEMVSQLAEVGAEVRQNPKTAKMLANALQDLTKTAAEILKTSTSLIPYMRLERAETLVRIAAMYTRLGQSRQTATILNEALQLAKGCHGSSGNKSSVLGRIAIAFASLGHYEPAYDVALALGNADWVVEETAGSIARMVAETALLLAKGGRADMADSLASLAISRHALDSRCLSDGVLTRCAELYTTLGRPDKALQVLSQFTLGRRTDALGIDLGIDAVLAIADEYERIGRRDLADGLLVRSLNVGQLTQHIQEHSSLWMTGELMTTRDVIWPMSGPQDSWLTCYWQQITTLLKRTVAAERAMGRPPPDALDRVLSAVEVSNDTSCRAEALSFIASLFAVDGQKAKAADILVRSLAAAKAIKDSSNATDPPFSTARALSTIQARSIREEVSQANKFSVASALLTIDAHCAAAGIEADDRAQQILREIA